MATKYVRDTGPGKVISAWIILKGSREVATVQACHGSGGRVLVNIFQRDKAAERSAATAAKAVRGKAAPEPSNFSFQSGSASGYGYDKLTAALSGLIVDGHQLTDHCAGSKRPSNGAGVFPQGFKPPRGWTMANYMTPKAHGVKVAGYANCYRDAGLDFLKAVGYRVIQAI